MNRHRYTAAQERWLHAHSYHYTKTQLARRFNHYFKLDLSAGAVGRKARQLGLTLKYSGPAYTGAFTPGRKPGPEARNTKPNRTTFKPNNVPKNTRPLGATRIDTKTGEVLVRTATGTPYYHPNGRIRTTHYYRARRLVVWEALHGPVPPGHAVIRLNADPRNDNPDELMLITRAELARLNQLSPLRDLPPDPQLRRAAVLRIQIHQRAHQLGHGTRLRRHPTC